MSGPFHRVHLIAADPATYAALESAAVVRGLEATGGFPTDEAAARDYLSRALTTVAPESLRGLAPAASSQAVPNLALRATTQNLPTDTRLLKFEQTHANVPVFGSHITVELRQDRSLVGIDGDLAAIAAADLLPSLGQKQALTKIAEFASIPAAQLEQSVTQSATLTLFHDDAANRWHLAFFFRRVPAAPPANPGVAAPSEPGHGLAPRPGRPEYDYLVDAHDGAILYYYSSSPTISTIALQDVLGQPRVIYVESQTPAFELHDALRKLKTFDLGGRDYWQPLPANPIMTPPPVVFSPAAVSAHANAAHVHDFYRTVLARQGVDDKGMYVISVINVTDSAHQPPPAWHNAVWYDNKMWYGQNVDAHGHLQSYARFLDVISHELTHGVTQFTADLVYRDQSGALNESFSDIFGVLINNWSPMTGFRPISEFNWHIGEGLGTGGKPLRDLSDPIQTGMPDHMTNYLKTAFDHGGVHTNSNIHNKAAYNVLTSKDAGGNYLFPPQDSAVLYYLCLVRLPRTATFDRVRQTLLDVTKTYYEAHGKMIQEAHVKAVAGAYTAVGIG